MPAAQSLCRPAHLASLFAVLVLWLAIVSSASAAVSCDLYASPAGSDQNPGTLASPVATLQTLDGMLAPGQTGCLQAGTYGTTHTYHYLTTAGTPTGQITLTSAPGQTAHIVGLVAVEGAYTTLSNLSIDGSNDRYTEQRAGTNCPYPVSNGLEIDGRGVIFENNDYYQSVPSLRGNGIGIGWNTPADGAIIRNNRIHDLGQCQAYDQMIYLAHGTGVQIYGNWMWNDPHGWGVQIYPGAANAHIHDNVIDAAGSGFVVGGSTAVANNTIDHNIIINSTGLPNAGLSQGVGISTCCGQGPGNSFTNNTVYANPGGIANATGITLTANTTTNPNLADPTHHDYRTTTLPNYNLWNGNLGDPASTAPGSTPTSTSTDAITTPAATASGVPSLVTLATPNPPLSAEAQTAASGRPGGERSAHSVRSRRAFARVATVAAQRHHRRRVRRAR